MTSYPLTIWRAAALARIQQVLRIGGRHRAGEQIALAQLAPGVAQQLALLAGFDTLRHTRHLQVLQQVDDGLHETEIARIHGHTGDERAIELHTLERQRPQVAQ